MFVRIYQQRKTLAAISVGFTVLPFFGGVIYIYIYIYLIYPRGSNSEHKPGAQNEHQPNAENNGLISWYDTDKFLYQNPKKDQVDTMNM